MKKTLILVAIALSSAIAAAADSEVTYVTHHGVNFYTEPAKGLQNYPNTDLNVTGYCWTNNSLKTYLGICIEAPASSDTTNGIRFNYGNGDNTTVTHLYLDPVIKIVSNGQGANNPGNRIIWNESQSGHKMVLSSTAGAWVDVNAVYDNIDLTQMNGGTVYLNKYGQIQGNELASGADNTVVVEANLSLADIVATPSLYSKQNVGANLYLVTRTLLTGNYVGWDGNVVLSDGTETVAGSTATANVWMPDHTDASAALEAGEYASLTQANVGSYFVTKDSTGVKITYLIPEPATATLSLLALAGLAARRRRK